MKSFLVICEVFLFAFITCYNVHAGKIDVIAVDRTPFVPLALSHQPRYISGFGSGGSFTLFFEDRSQDYLISFISTTSGPTGLPSSATPTNIKDTHFCVKDWPISIDGTRYSYRA
jgi:hypothetical protein